MQKYTQHQPQFEQWGPQPPHHSYPPVPLQQFVPEKRPGKGQAIAALVLSICSVSLFLLAFFMSVTGSLAAFEFAVLSSFILQIPVSILLLIAVVR